jgi:hypothetical protein
MIKDRYGLAVSTTSLPAAEKYFKAMDSALAGNAFSEKWFEEAALIDPTFALAQIVHAENLLLQGKKEEAIVFKNKALGLSIQSTEREQQHIAIVAMLMNGKSNAALAAIVNHVKKYPTDALLVAKAVGGFGLFAFSGEVGSNQQRLQFMNTLAPAYGNDWWFLSMHAFAYVELFHFKEAKEKVEQSLQLYYRNGHAAHSYSHVCYEMGQNTECIRFASQWLQGYEREAHLYGHIHWHWALSELANENFEKVNELYQQHLCPTIAMGGAVGLIADAAALQWRSQLKGFNLLEYEQNKSLQKYSIDNNNMADILFGEAHLALVFTQPNLALERENLVSAIKNRHQKDAHPKYAMMLNLIEGVTAFANENYQLAATLLAAANPQLARLGGSHAQRDLFEDTLIQSYLMLGNTIQATTLIDARIHRKQQFSTIF